VATRLGERLVWLFELTPKLTPVQWQVLTYQLLVCCDRDGRHWHSSRSIADALNMSERAVRRVQLELDELGVIDRTKRRRSRDGRSQSTLVYVLAPGVHRFHRD
jgi:predicted transcriptional regulator